MPNTGMAVTIDIGDANDIHPKNKQDVGKRLALWALANTYGKDVVYSGPLYKSMAKKGDKIVLHFDHVGGGLVANGGEPLKGFAIAGADKKFVWADAKIDGDTVVVSQRRRSPTRWPSATPGPTTPSATCTTRPACPPRRSAPTLARRDGRQQVRVHRRPNGVSRRGREARHGFRAEEKAAS